MIMVGYAKRAPLRCPWNPISYHGARNREGWIFEADRDREDIMDRLGDASIRSGVCVRGTGLGDMVSQKEKYHGNRNIAPRIVKLLMTENNFLFFDPAEEAVSNK